MKISVHCEDKDVILEIISLIEKNTDSAKQVTIEMEEIE